MNFRSALGLLAPSFVAFAMVACSVKQPPPEAGVPVDDLVEQSTALVDLSSEDVVQILFDEASRVDRALRLAIQPVGDGVSEDGCITYRFLPASKQTLVIFECTGLEERHDTEKIGRTLRGREVLRLNENGGTYAGDVDVRRFRSTDIAKTLRTARVSRSTRFVGKTGTAIEAAIPSLVTDSKTQYLGQRTKVIPTAESWTAAIHGEWKQLPAQPLVMGVGSKLALKFTAESGSSYDLVLTPLEDVSFERGVNNKCLRPIGSFAAKLTQRKAEKLGEVKVTVIEKQLETTNEGFAFAGSTSVVAWPMGCLENVP
jgi:hypothetical protein